MTRYGDRYDHVTHADLDADERADQEEARYDLEVEIAEETPDPRLDPSHEEFTYNLIHGLIVRRNGRLEFAAGE